MKGLVSLMGFAIISMVFANISDAKSTHNTYHNNLTFLSTHELKPAPSYQIAKSTFLPDIADNLGDINLDYNQNPCQKYPLDSCPKNAKCKYCPFDIHKFRVTTCSSPYILQGDYCECPPMVYLTYPNDKCIKYCDSLCIQKTCIPSADQEECTLGTAPCDNGCGAMSRNCCLQCQDTIETKPENAHFVLEECIDGDGTHQVQTKWECDDGYYKSGEICKKNCISNPCSGYDLIACPADKICEECTITATNCTTDGNRYKAIGCKITGQVDLDNYWCNGALRCWLN